MPNPHGFYEDAPLHLADWSPFRGRAVKVVRDNFGLIPTGERLKVVYLWRDPAEIRRSYRGILSGPHDDSVFAFLDNYGDKVDGDMARLQGLGAQVVILDYAAVVANPLWHLAALNWPIDAARAAATVDPALYRHRGTS